MQRLPAREGDAVVLPPAADEAEALDAALAEAANADMLLISGGVSAGKFDLVEPVSARSGRRGDFRDNKQQRECERGDKRQNWCPNFGRIAARVVHFALEMIEAAGMSAAFTS